MPDENIKEGQESQPEDKTEESAKQKPDLSVFIEQLKKQPLSKVEFLFKHIDKENNPDRYEAIKAEMERRKKAEKQKMSSSKDTVVDLGFESSAAESVNEQAAGDKKPAGKSKLKPIVEVPASADLSSKTPVVDSIESAPDAAAETSDAEPPSSKQKPKLKARKNAGDFESSTHEPIQRDTTVEKVPAHGSVQFDVFDAAQGSMQKVDNADIEDFFTKKEDSQKDSFFSFMLWAAIIVMALALYVVCLSLFDLPGKQELVRLLKISDAVAGKNL